MIGIRGCELYGAVTLAWCVVPVTVQALASNTAVFKVLNNNWTFSTPANDPDGCLVDFLVEYQFHNALYGQVRRSLSFSQ